MTFCAAYIEAKGGDEQVKIGTRKVMVCKATGKPVIMQYEGHFVTDSNGHPKWLCLHNENEMLDVVEARAFNAGQGKRSKYI